MENVPSRLRFKGCLGADRQHGCKADPGCLRRLDCLYSEITDVVSVLHRVVQYQIALWLAATKCTPHALLCAALPAIGGALF